VSSQKDVARFSTKPVAHPLRWIVRLEIPCGGELCQRVARTPVRFSCLFRAELTTVPDHDRFGAASRGLGRQPLNRCAAVLRQWPLRVHVRANGVTVVN